MVELLSNLGANESLDEVDTALIQRIELGARTDGAILMIYTHPYVVLDEVKGGSASLILPTRPLTFSFPAHPRINGFVLLQWPRVDFNQ